MNKIEQSGSILLRLTTVKPGNSISVPIPVRSADPEVATSPDGRSVEPGDPMASIV